MIDVTVLRAMAAAGATTEMILAAVEAAQDCERRRLADKRVKDAERQRRYRERHAVSRGVTVVTRDICDNPSPSSPPFPPSLINPSPLPPPPSPSSDIRAVAKATRPQAPEEFEEFWKAYPKREGSNPKAPARKLFFTALKTGACSAEIITGARRYAEKERANVGTPYIPQAVKWLRNQYWHDYQSQGPPNGQPAYLTPPPGCRSLEEIHAQYGKTNGKIIGAGIRSDAGMGEDRPDRPAKLQLPG